jgi:hypothetical protein
MALGRATQVKLIDRFTLDDVSAKIWWPLTLLALVGLVLTFPAGNRAVDHARADAAERAAELSTSRIELSPTLPPTSLPSLVRTNDAERAADVLVAYQQDPIWSDVRVWSPQFTLWASSSPQEQQDELGSGEANNDDSLRAATDDGSFSIVTDRLPTGGAGPTTFHAYTRIGGLDGAYITEFEARDSVLLADVHRDWLGYRIVGAVALLIVLGLAIASMREPRAAIGTNVPFYPESVPVGRSIIDTDRAAELQQADDRIQDRINGLQERLDESERLRLKAEAQLQQALTALGSGARSITAPKPAAPREQQVEPPIRAPRPRSTPVEPAVQQPAPAVGQPAPAVEQPAPAVQQPAPAGEPQRVSQPTPTQQPARRAKPVAPSPQPKQVPQTQPAAKPAAAAASAAATAERAAKAAAQRTAKTPPPPVTSPQPATKPPPAPPKRRAGKHEKADPVTVRAEEVSVTAAPYGNGESSTPEAPAQPSRPEVVVVPEPEKARVGARTGDRDSDAAVLDVLNRLVPAGEEPHTTPEPGDLRARLARTAALKKPGSRERQEQRDSGHDGPAQE